MTAEPLTSLELAWSLRERVSSVFSKPLHDLDVDIRNVGDGPRVVDANDPGRFQRACMMGMAAVTDLSLDDSLPEKVRAALHSLPTHYQVLLNTLMPAGQAIAAAGPDVRNIQNLEGLTGLLQGAAQAANPATPVGVATIGGATIGTLLMPGIGTAIGGAIGVWLGGRQVSKRDRLAVQRFAAAIKLMWAAVEDLQHNLWNQLVRSVREQQGPSLPDAAYFDTAATRLESPLPRPGEMAAFRDHLEVYVREWGPHPRALAIAARLCLPPYPLDLTGLEKWTAKYQQLYPADPDGYENRARLAIEKADVASALQCAEQGLRLASTHAGLREIRLEALAALGRIAEAEEAARLIRQSRPPVGPELALIRGLMRGGRRDEAVERVRAWVRRDGKPAAIARQLQVFAPTARLFAEGAAPIPEFANLQPGLDSGLQAAVEEHLQGDGTRSFLGAPPEEKLRQAGESWLHLEPDERLLFFHDWSLWHNAKTGLAITNRRLLWKYAWEDPVSVDLRAAPRSQVCANKGVLTIANQRVDLQDEALAASLAGGLTEMLDAFARPAARVPRSM
jgi:hypothetical protein